MKSKTQTIYRSAITGRFVTAKKAKKSPKSTVSEVIKIKRKKKC